MKVRSRIFSKRAQAAIEYMITYGWAFLVIIGAISALSYFGLLNPERYIPNTCDFGEQLKCVDQYIDDGGTIILRYRNNFEADINISDASGEDISNFIGVSGGTGDPVTIGQGEVKRIVIETDRPLSVDNKERFKISLTFQRTGGSIPHNLTGVVFTEVVDEDLGLV